MRALLVTKSHANSMTRRCGQLMWATIAMGCAPCLESAETTVPSVVDESVSPKAARPWFVSAYGAVGTRNNLDHLTKHAADFEDSYLVLVSGGREFYRYRDWASLEWEGQVGKHWDFQDHWEFNAFMTVRWLKFPWDRFLDTSFASGNGLSYATEEPEIEIEKNDETARLLYYLMFELDFALPQLPEWSVFTRIHHRSGVFGLFDGVKGGSNFIAGGVRYRF
jgi:hypothetical protein